MIKLYDSAFSPFARKVRIALEYKGLNYEAVDALLRSNHAALKAVNGRIEVPVLVDGDVVVVNSADIISYLDHRYPAKWDLSNPELPLKILGADGKPMPLPAGLTWIHLVDPGTPITAS